MLYLTVFHISLVDVIVMLSCTTVLHGCDVSDVEDNSIQTCVEDLTLDEDTRREIEALSIYYEDFPTHCRYGQCAAKFLP